MAAESEHELRAELRDERAGLADAVEKLRTELGAATDLRSRLPLLAAGAFGLGFVKSGGIGATMRLFFRRSREGGQKARAGRFSLVKK